MLEVVLRRHHSKLIKSVFHLLAVYLSANQIISSFTRCLFVYAFIRLCARVLICLMFLLSVWVRICDYDWVKLT